MTSADFLAHRNRVYSKISLGRVNILAPNPAISTILVLSLFRALDFGMMCYLIRPHSLCIWFLFVSSGTAVWLTSVHESLQTTLPLALLRVTTPAHRGLPPVGTVNFLTYIHHSRHTQWLKNHSHPAGWQRFLAATLPAIKFDE